MPPIPLTLATWPRGLSRVQAAAYVGIVPSFFDKQVADGMLPKPARMGKRKLWDRLKLDSALDRIFDGATPEEPEIVLQ